MITNEDAKSRQTRQIGVGRSDACCRRGAQNHAAPLELAERLLIFPLTAEAAGASRFGRRGVCRSEICVTLKTSGMVPFAVHRVHQKFSLLHCIICALG
jgi:hypothetical protein